LKPPDDRWAGGFETGFVGSRGGQGVEPGNGEGQGFERGGE